MLIEVKKGPYFSYGDKYFVEFHYESKDQQERMFQLFDKALIPTYGSHSDRGKHGNEYIMPYLADEQGQMSTQNTRRVGGTSIPEDLLPAFIQRFVEVDGATVRIGDGEIKGKFDYNQFYEMLSQIELQVELKKGPYFGYGEKYYVEFQYGSQEQQEDMFQLFDEVFIPSYGSNSYWSRQGKEYIMPYLADEQGQMTTQNTRKIGGTSIPKAFLAEFIRRFVELDGATVKVGDKTIRGHFDYDQFNEILASLDGNITK